MTRTGTAKALACGFAAVALVGVAFSASVGAQSPFMAGEGMPYAAFDALPKTDVRMKGGVIHVGFAPGELALPRDAVLDWIAKSARAISIYYGRFPVRSARLLIVPVPGGRVQGGTTWGYRGAAIRIPLGMSADRSDLDRDWVMTHEMVHLALPDVAEPHTWLAEGMAVYIEPVARAQAGDLRDEQIWADMVRDMPKGLPGPGDGGLDDDGGWGRTYWGGAMFCLLADVEIRKRTGNRLGLQDAVRGVLAAGGDHEVDWTPDRIFAAADKAIGQPVLAELYARMGRKAVSPDLDALWRDLGVVAGAGGVTFDDAAPLAAIRAAITKSRAP
jgi:hypothetical protein